MTVEIDASGSGVDEQETSSRGIELALRIQNGGLMTQHDTEKRRKSFLIWPSFDRNFNFQMGECFKFINFMFFFS